MQVREVEFVKGATQWEHLPTDGLPEVAFVGRSNVGKSSLLNMLVGRTKLARISGTPGKTQQFNYYLVNKDLYFVDLPGYGYARVSRTQRDRWGRFIGRYLTERVPLRIVFHLVDSRHPPSLLDEDVMALLREQAVPYVIALTKTDKLSGNQQVKSRRVIEKVLGEKALEVPVIFTSAMKKQGRDDLWRWIEDLAG